MSSEESFVKLTGETLCQLVEDCLTTQLLRAAVVTEPRAVFGTANEILQIAHNTEDAADPPITGCVSASGGTLDFTWSGSSIYLCDLHSADCGMFDRVLLTDAANSDATAWLRERLKISPSKGTKTRRVITGEDPSGINAVAINGIPVSDMHVIHHDTHGAWGEPGYYLILCLANDKDHYVSINTRDLAHYSSARPDEDLVVAFKNGCGILLPDSGETADIPAEELQKILFS